MQDSNQKSEEIERELKVRFLDLAAPHSGDKKILLKLWDEIRTAYSRENRFYHNLKHLHQLFLALEGVKNEIEDWEIISFSVFYHDIIYNVRRQDNEEKSAELAKERLTALGIETSRIESCVNQINATKTHQSGENLDTALFTDADLIILGQDWPTYLAYTKSIRKEYRIYPAILYRSGRKKVIAHFISQPELFKTSHFRDKYEVNARKNLLQEFESL